MAPSRTGYATLKTVMICFNAIVFVVGCTMVGLGLWIKLGSTSFVRVLGATSVYFAHVGYFCIVVGSVVVMLGFMGCWGAVKENRCLLLMYFLIMLVIFNAEITAAVVVFAFTSFARSIVLDKSLTALKKKYSGYKHDDIVSYGWNAFMLKVGDPPPPRPPVSKDLTHLFPRITVAPRSLTQCARCCTYTVTAPAVTRWCERKDSLVVRTENPGSVPVSPMQSLCDLGPVTWAPWAPVPHRYHGDHSREVGSRCPAGTYMP
ncbi:tetraspanin-16 isoform X1 [Gopherus flavomarginatus]|uniref:tetraspanin-16 isoform X1 n=1 Tax=Gopherus flavomarginatus TaxID=286002 RepID=UPI0021CBE834|nr:tetraspanin-16 isoform X1 [Gopherus flavomarginatus]